MPIRIPPLSLHLLTISALLIPSIQAYCMQRCICNMETIICKRAQLKYVPKLDYNTDILTIDLSDNDIEEITAASFKNIPNAKYLQLFENRIIDIEDASFNFLDELTYLDLSDNMLEEFSGALIIENHQLIALDLSENYITTAPVLNSTGLRKINLSYNKLSYFTFKNLEGLPNLQELDLSGNNLKYVNPAVFVRQSPNLNSVNLRMNAWECSCKVVEMVYALSQTDILKHQKLHCLYNGRHQEIFKDKTLYGHICESNVVEHEEDLIFGPNGAVVETKNLDGEEANNDGLVEEGNEEVQGHEEGPMLTIPQVIFVVLNAFLLAIFIGLICFIVRRVKRRSSNSQRQHRQQASIVKENLKYINIQS